MTTRRRARSDRPRYDTFVDRLAVLVSSEEFAVAFVWWNVLLALAPACAACALHFHATGAVHAAISIGLVGAAIAVVSIVRLTAIAGGLRRAFIAA